MQIRLYFRVDTYYGSRKEVPGKRQGNGLLERLELLDGYLFFLVELIVVRFILTAVAIVFCGVFFTKSAFFFRLISVHPTGICTDEQGCINQGVLAQMPIDRDARCTEQHGNCEYNMEPLGYKAIHRLCKLSLLCCGYKLIVIMADLEIFQRLIIDTVV